MVGGGSGGIAAARRAASHGARVALVEASKLGGTCVNLGCVPKKIMFYAAQLADSLPLMAPYGVKASAPAEPGALVDFAQLKRVRDEYVGRMNLVYAKNLATSRVDVFRGFGAFDDLYPVDPRADTAPIVKVLPPWNATSVQFETPGAPPADAGATVRLRAKHVLLAPGGKPLVPQVPGHELGLTSDGFFALDRVPRSAIVVGGGYIGCELAGILRSLGADVSVVLREDAVLPSFDPAVRAAVEDAMAARGIRVHHSADLVRAERASSAPPRVRLLWKPLPASDASTLDSTPASSSHGSSMAAEAELLLFATGRTPQTESLGLAHAGVATDPRTGAIVTDEWQQTSAPRVCAVGDATGRVQLTPVAIAAGRLLADRLFGGDAQARLSYETIPTVVFTHPPVGVVGLSEPQARAKFGADQVKVFAGKFNPMKFSTVGHADPFHMKVVCAGPAQTVVGIHVVGEAADEIIQGFAVAVKMGATKRDLDSTMAIHPTAAEELVTMVPWKPHNP